MVPDRSEAQTNGGLPIRRRRPATVHMMFVLGPSVSSPSAARARVLLEVEGFDVRVWGERSDTEATQPLDGGDDEYSDRSDESDDGEDEEDRSINDREEVMSEQDVEATPPPLSRSPSPSSPASLSSSSYSSTDTLSRFESDEDSEEEEASQAWPEETEMDLRAAERLLSRALAMANAEVGMVSEICRSLLLPGEDLSHFSDIIFIRQLQHKFISFSMLHVASIIPHGFRNRILARPWIKCLTMLCGLAT